MVDAINHWMVVWVITTSTQVPDAPPGDAYHPNKQTPIAKTTHEEKSRIVCAKEFKTKKEAEEFITKAPPDVKPHCHLIDEDQ